MQRLIQVYQSGTRWRKYHRVPRLVCHPVRSPLLLTCSVYFEQLCVTPLMSRLPHAAPFGSAVDHRARSLTIFLLRPCSFCVFSRDKGKHFPVTKANTFQGQRQTLSRDKGKHFQVVCPGMCSSSRHSSLCCSWQERSPLVTNIKAQQLNC